MVVVGIRVLSTKNSQDILMNWHVWYLEFSLLCHTLLSLTLCVVGASRDSAVTRVHRSGCCTSQLLKIACAVISGELATVRGRCKGFVGRVSSYNHYPSFPRKVQPWRGCPGCTASRLYGCGWEGEPQRHRVNMQSGTAEVKLWCDTFPCTNTAVGAAPCSCSVYHLPHITYSDSTTGGLLRALGINSHRNEELTQSRPLLLLHVQEVLF